MGSDTWADTGEMLGGGGCALVYCRSCAEAERVCDGLTDLGLVAAFYHAQVSPETTPK